MRAQFPVSISGRRPATERPEERAALASRARAGKEEESFELEEEFGKAR